MIRINDRDGELPRTPGELMATRLRTPGLSSPPPLLKGARSCSQATQGAERGAGGGQGARVAGVVERGSGQPPPQEGDHGHLVMVTSMMIVMMIMIKIMHMMTTIKLLHSRQDDNYEKC